MPQLILLVDDDELLRRSLAFNLQSVAYRVETAASAEEALEKVSHETPNLILLDINLPGMDGLQVVRLLRDHAPVIFLTARMRALDEVLGLELGAQDYITKPFDLDVLLARIRVVLQRFASRPQTRAQPLVAGDLTIDTGAHTILLRGQSVSLPPLEFRLLHYMAQNAGHVLSTEQLLTQVWGPGYAGEPQVVYVCIRSLREKLETDPGKPRRIMTVRGVGYKLVPQEK